MASRPMELAKKFVVAEKSMNEVLASSSATMVIKGAEEFTFFITTGSLPVVKNDKIEFTSPLGMKSVGRGKNQTLNSLQISFDERTNMAARKALQEIQMNPSKNGKLEIEFYIGDAELLDTRLWGVGLYGLISVEDGAEFDVEGSTSPMKGSFTLDCHYFPENCDIDKNARASATDALGDFAKYKAEEC